MDPTACEAYYTTDLLDQEPFGATWQHCILNDEFLAFMDNEQKHSQLLKLAASFLELALTKEDENVAASQFLSPW